MNTMCRAHVFAVLFCLGYALPGVALENEKKTTDTSSLASALDVVLEKAIAEQRLVGGVVLVARKGNIIYSRAAGYADRENKKVMQENTIFRLSSVSKAFTSMAAAVLLQQGKMHLDDPVTKWLPDFTPRLPDGTQPIITIQHLLSHTSGIDYMFSEPENGPYHKAGVSDGLENSSISLAENVRRISSAPLLFQPGTSWQYSLSTDVLGAVIAEVSGLPLPGVIQELITRPLGMQDTGFSVTDRSRLAVPYYNAAPHPLPMKEEEHVTFGEMTFHYSPGRALDPKAFPSAGAGMVGTAPEVLRLLETIRQGTPLVTSEIMKDMNSNRIGDHRAAPGAGFGLGWAVLVDPAEAKSPQSAGTLRWGGVYGHHWFVDPEKSLSVVILTNTAPEGIFGAIIDEVRDTVYAHLP